MFILTVLCVSTAWRNRLLTFDLYCENEDMMAEKNEARMEEE